MPTKEQILEVLTKCDPMGIMFENNKDEYKPEAESICLRLKKDVSQEEIKQILVEEFQKWFGKETVENKDINYDEIAKDIYGLKN